MFLKDFFSPTFFRFKNVKGIVKLRFNAKNRNVLALFSLLPKIAFRQAQRPKKHAKVKCPLGHTRKLYYIIETR